MVTIIVWVVLIIIAIGVVGSLFSAALGLVNLAIMILSWMLIGFLAGKLLRGRGYGPLGDTALGLAGGVVGSILLRGIADITLVGGVIAGVLGAVIVVFAVRLFGNENFAR
ncbi:MAG: hypothetical protein OHK0046_12190 [Anaerolineae bacterium]